MKKRNMLIALAIIGILGSCATLAVAAPITTLGNLDYYNTQDNFCINGNIQGNANLGILYSDVNKSAIKADKIWYDSFTDKTTYKFTTQKIFVDWWFTPSIKEFVYIDETSNKLYRVYVNYTLIDIPENPYIKQHRELKENYTMLLTDYNLTNSTLANITLQFNQLDALYNITMQQFNMNRRDYTNTSTNLTKLTAAFIELNGEYNKTDALWKSAIDNVTYYQTNYDGKVGDYNRLEKDHNALSDMLPWYIIIAIIGTFLFTYIYARRKTIFEPHPETTDEITTGYGKLHSAIDHHVLSRFRGGPKTCEKEGIEELTENTNPLNEIIDIKTVEEHPIQKKDSGTKNQISTNEDDILTIVHEKIDANSRATNIKIDTLFRKLNEKIDRITKGEKLPDLE